MGYSIYIPGTLLLPSYLFVHMCIFHYQCIMNSWWNMCLKRIVTAPCKMFTDGDVSASSESAKELSAHQT